VIYQAYIQWFMAGYEARAGGNSGGFRDMPKSDYPGVEKGGNSRKNWSFFARSAQMRMGITT
jgi:hypothetical protein